MVQRISNIFNREFSGLHKAALLLASSSLISGILGLFRDRLLAGMFGAGKTLDIYYASFRIPDFFYIMSLSIASITVLIPFFLEKMDSSKENAHSFLNQIFTVFILGIIFISILAFIFAPYLAKMLTPGFSETDINHLVLLTRIMLFSPILLGLSNLLSTVVQSFRRFLVYALSPIFYNFGIIFGIVYLAPKWGINGVAVGVVLGTIMHAFIQIPAIIKLGFFPKLEWKIDFGEIWKIIRFSLPRTLGLSLYQIVLIFITSIASFLAVGSIAVFNLSMNLQSVLLSVVGISYSVAAFPTLARLFINNQKEEFLNHTFSAARQIIFWSIPISVLFIVLRAQIVRVILGTGMFSWSDTRLVAASLAVFSISITAQALVILFIRAFYAAGKTIRPLMVNIFSSLFTIALSLFLVGFIKNSNLFKGFFVKIFRLEGISNIEILMLPLAFSLGMIINMVFLLIYFKKDLGWIKNVINKVFSQVFLASAMMGSVTYICLGFFDDIFDIQTFLGIFLQGFLSGIIGIMIGAIVLLLLRNKETGEIVSSFKQKFWKSPIVIPESENLDNM